MRRHWAPIVAVYAAIVLTFCLVVLGAIVTGAVVAERAGATQLLTGVGITAVILVFCALVLSVGLATPFFATATERLRLRAPDPLNVLIAAAGVLGTSFFLDGLIGLLGLQDVGTLADIRNTLGVLPALEKLGAALVIGFGPGIGEELFFRGYVLRRLGFLGGTWHALITSSVAFGFFHLDLVQGSAATFLGLYLGVSVLLTGSLWTGVLAHAMNNMAATALALVEIDDVRAIVLMVAGLVASISGLVLLRRRGVGIGRSDWTPNPAPSDLDEPFTSQALQRPGDGSEG